MTDNGIALNAENFDAILDDLVQQANDTTTQDNDFPVKNDMQHKLDLMTLTNGWNDKNERIIISVGENAASYKWMHERSARMYALINKVFGVVQIVISTSLSAETVIPTENDSAVDLARSIFTYILTILSVLSSFLKYEKLSEQHNVAANEFGQLYHEIQEQMVMYRRDRVKARSYVTTILKKYDSMVLRCPSIGNLVIGQFKRTFGNSDIAIPDIADRIQKIEVVNEPEVGRDKSVQVKGRSLREVARAKTIAAEPLSRGVCNLSQIHNAFQIHGDITDSDIQNSTAIELKEMQSKFMREKSNFEYNRYLSHYYSDE